MWGGRFAPRMPWSSVALRRRSDRIQAWLTLMLVVVALIGTPWVTWWVAGTVYRAEVRAGSWERQHRHQVTAVLAQDAVGRRDDGGQAPPVPPNASAFAYWTGPQGTVHTGTVPAEVGMRVGSTVTVWVDGRGTPTAPPRQRHPLGDASAAGALAVLALTASLGAIRHLVVRYLDRRRLCSWEAEWLIVGPQWSRR